MPLKMRILTIPGTHEFGTYGVAKFQSREARCDSKLCSPRSRNITERGETCVGTLPERTLGA